MLLEVWHTILKEQESLFLYDMMDGQPHAGICCEKSRGRREKRLPRALRSSSKFSLLFIFQVPAKLGMSAEAEHRELLEEPVPR